MMAGTGDLTAYSKLRTICEYANYLLRRTCRWSGVNQWRLAHNSNSEVIIAGFVRHVRFYAPAIMFYE